MNQGISNTLKIFNKSFINQSIYLNSGLSLVRNGSLSFSLNNCATSIRSYSIDSNSNRSTRIQFKKDLDKKVYKISNKDRRNDNYRESNSYSKRDNNIDSNYQPTSYSNRNGKERSGSGGYGRSRRDGRDVYTNNNNNNRDREAYQLKGEGLFGVNPIWIALYADNRSFNNLYIQKILYQKIQKVIDYQNYTKEMLAQELDEVNDESNDNEEGEVYIADKADENDNEVDTTEKEKKVKKPKKPKLQNINRDRKNVEALVDIVKKCREMRVNIIPAEKQLLDTFAKFRVHQGMVLDCSPLTIPTLAGLSEADLSEYNNRYPLVIALDELWDPQNTGAIVRSCHYFGADGVVVTDKGSVPVTPFASKSSSGAIEEFPMFKCLSLHGFIKESKKQGWHVIGTTLSEKSKDISTVKLSKPTILVIGNEGYGLKDKIVQQCDEIVKIKGYEKAEGDTAINKVDSLNASVTTGIIVHQLMATNKVN